MSWKAAPAVGDLLVLGQRVGDQREDAQVLLEGLCERFGRLAANVAVRVLQPVERRLERQLLAVDGEAQVCHRLVEQPVPGAAPGDRLFVEQLLDPVLELVGLVLAQVEHPGAVMAERRHRRRARVRISASSTRLSSSAKNSRCALASVIFSWMSP